MNCVASVPSGIQHADLYLWDAWSCHINGELHLYCLALNRRDVDGSTINPDHRNNHAFHVHHFASSDGGLSWRDRGIFQQPDEAGDDHDKRNIWSGSVSVDEDGVIWVGYTGIEQPAPDQPFIQNLGLTKTRSSDRASAALGWLMSSPTRDYVDIREKGYFMDSLDRLGHVSGEPGGAILAWRDPFLFDHEGSSYMAFAAKASPTEPAMGLARYSRDNPEAGVELLPPVRLPDVNEFTQFEVPKIYALPNSNQLLLVCATTDRKSEDQPAEEVNMLIRLYVGDDIQGPWRPAGTRTSVLGNTDFLFGATVTAIDAASGTIQFMAPYTTATGDNRMLTFAPMFTVLLEDLEHQEQILAQR